MATSMVLPDSWLPSRPHARLRFATHSMPFVTSGRRLRRRRPCRPAYYRRVSVYSMRYEDKPRQPLHWQKPGPLPTMSWRRVSLSCRVSLRSPPPLHVSWPDASPARFRLSSRLPHLRRGNS